MYFLKKIELETKLSKLLNLKRILIFLSFITITATVIFNCERDDICAETTQTTARLIVEFYDAADIDELKNVTRLTVYGEGLFTDENGDITEPLEASDTIVASGDGYLFNVNTNRIELPLKVDDTLNNPFITTRFVLEKDTNLRLDTENSQTSNKDIIEITYNSEFDYVSRACGYKSIFTNLNLTSEIDSDPWIANIEIVETTIENENTTHIRIFY